jgi:hypothetical protein
MPRCERPAPKGRPVAGPRKAIESQVSAPRTRGSANWRAEKMAPKSYEWPKEFPEVYVSR